MHLYRRCSRTLESSYSSWLVLGVETHPYIIGGTQLVNPGGFEILWKDNVRGMVEQNPLLRTTHHGNRNSSEDS